MQRRLDCYTCLCWTAQSGQWPWGVWVFPACSRRSVHSVAFFGCHRRRRLAKPCVYPRPAIPRTDLGDCEPWPFLPCPGVSEVIHESECYLHICPLNSRRILDDSTDQFTRDQGRVLKTGAQFAAKKQHVHEAALHCGVYEVAIGSPSDSCTTQSDIQNSA